MEITIYKFNEILQNSDKGYFKHPSRSSLTDKDLVKAANNIGISLKELEQWCLSIFGEVRMDQLDGLDNPSISEWEDTLKNDLECLNKKSQ